MYAIRGPRHPIQEMDSPYINLPSIEERLNICADYAELCNQRRSRALPAY